MKEVLKLSLLPLTIGLLLYMLYTFNKPRFEQGNLVRYSGTYGTCTGIIIEGPEQTTIFNQPIYIISGTCSRYTFKMQSSVPQIDLTPIEEFPHD